MELHTAWKSVGRKKIMRKNSKKLISKIHISVYSWIIITILDNEDFDLRKVELQNIFIFCYYYGTSIMKYFLRISLHFWFIRKVERSISTLIYYKVLAIRKRITLKMCPFCQQRAEGYCIFFGLNRKIIARKRRPSYVL